MEFNGLYTIINIICSFCNGYLAVVRRQPEIRIKAKSKIGENRGMEGMKNAFYCNIAESINMIQYMVIICKRLLNLIYWMLFCYVMI